MSNHRRSRFFIPDRKALAATIFASRPAGNQWTLTDATKIANAVFDLIVEQNEPPPKNCKHGHGPLQGFQIRKSGKSQRYCLVCDILRKKDQREAKTSGKKQIARKSVEELVARRLARSKQLETQPKHQTASLDSDTTI